MTQPSPLHLAGLTVAAPPDMVVEQAMVALRGAAPTGGDPRLLQKQTAIRTSLIAHRRDVGKDASLEVLAGEVTAELVSSIGGLSGLATEAFDFQDGALGLMVSFDFAAAEVGTARQFHALRKDGTVLTTLTLTLDKLQLTDDGKRRWLAVLASASPLNPVGAL
jgi:hypothetical protein